MHTSVVVLDAVDHDSILTRIWLPDAEPVAAVQIVHGMAEHSARYAAFAAALVEVGYVVYANDLRGHGRTAGDLAKVGHFADRHGWELAVADLMSVTDRINEDHPELPVVLLGHSMGEVLARDYAGRHGERFAGLVLMGSQGDPGPLGAVGSTLSRLERRLRGRRHRSRLMNSMIFGAFNGSFAPNRTAFDWLSRDDAAVDAYVDDPWCGFVCTTTFYRDLVAAVRAVNRAEGLAGTPEDLPILVMAGQADPSSHRGKVVRQVCGLYSAVGVRDVSGRIYEGARHELLHETNRDQVVADLIGWLSTHAISRTGRRTQRLHP